MTNEVSITPMIWFVVIIAALTIFAMATAKDVLPGLYTRRPKARK